MGDSPPRSMALKLWSGLAGGRFVSFDFAVADADDAIGVGSDVLLVGDENDGVAALMEASEKRHDFFAGGGVEIASGFVGEKDGGRVDESASDGDALALTAGEFVGLVHHAVGEIDLRERFLGALDAFGSGSAVVDHGQLDVVKSGGAREQVERLKDEADFLVADVGELVVVELADEATAEPVAAFARRIEAADEVHQRRLAGPGRAHDGDVFALANLHVDAAERVQLFGAHFVCLPEVVGLDDDAGVDEILTEGLG